MPTILLTNHFSKKSKTFLIKEVPEGYDLFTLKKATKNELIKMVDMADYLLVSGTLTIDKEIIDKANKLKMIQRTGVGLNILDLKAIQERGIPVYVNFGVNSFSVAEHTIMLILSVMRNINLANCSLQKGKWEKREIGLQSQELRGKTVGLIGLGHIGKIVAKMLQPFNVNTIYYKPSKLTDIDEKELQVTYQSFEELLAKADIISLHCPLTNDTHELISIKELNLLKPGSILINTARGKLINESDLIEALQGGKLKGAGLDVFYNEPLPKNSLLLNLKNVVLTPHSAGTTCESFVKMMSEAMQNIKLFEEGKYDLIEQSRVLLTKSY